MHHRFRLIAALALASPAVVAAQSGGTIAGRVTDRTTGTAIPNAQVIVVGTQRGTRTDVQEYRLINVPEGSARVRAALATKPD
jgi:hypothetical protein